MFCSFSDTARFVLVSILSGAVLFGCSSTTTAPGTVGTDAAGDGGAGDVGTDAAGDGGAGDVGTSYKCCVGDEYYTCGDKTAYDRCAGFDLGACWDACGEDIDCIEACGDKEAMWTPDPSSCTRNTSLDSTCGGVDPGDGGVGDICPIAGNPCTYTSDCGSGKHCSSGRCYANQAGCPCTYTSDCGSGAHCTSSKCWKNEAGSPCTYSSDCGPGAHCTSGKCYSDG